MVDTRDGPEAAPQVEAVPEPGLVDICRHYAGAWPRFWARMFDTSLLAALLGVLVGLIFPELFQDSIFAGKAGDILIGVLLLPFVLLADAAILAAFGTTPGKLLAGIRAERIDGAPIGRLAFRRNLQIYVFGYWLGLPLLILVGYTRAFNRLGIQGATRWDERLDTLVIERGNNGFRTALVAVLALGINFGAQAFGKYAEHMQPEWEREGIVAALPEMNRGLPRFTDEITRLDGILFTLEEGVLTYEYRLIHKDASRVAREEIGTPGEVRAGLIEHYCGPDMAYFRDLGIPARHRFRLGDGVHADYRLEPSDCRSQAKVDRAASLD